MQDTEETDLRTEVFRVTSDFEKGYNKHPNPDFFTLPLVLAVALVSQSSGFNVGCDAGTCQRIPLVRDRLRTFLNGRPFRILFYVGN